MLLLVISTLFLLSSNLAAESPPRELTGKIIAEDSGEALAGVEVTIVELDRTTRTGKDGAFRFVNVPAGEFKLDVHADNYARILQTVRLPAREPLAISLWPDFYSRADITVTADPWAVNPLQTSRSVDQVGQQRIKREGDNSVGEALEHLPGLANIGTGDALGTPVIRGIAENRVRILNDGVPLNQQQWSFRHSPNIEPILAERVEIVRGPATVMWGPDALGGVVNIVQPPLPSSTEGKSVFLGEAGVGYFGNNEQAQGDLVLEGASGAFGWRIGAVRRDAGDLETPDGRLPHTDYQQTNGAVSGGLSGSWGSARVRWDHWEDDVGFYFPAGDPNEGFRLRLRDETYSAKLVLPTAAGEVNLLLARQENHRKAFPPAAPVFPDPAVNLEEVTTTLRAGFSHRKVGAWKGNFEAEYRGIRNNVLGPVALVPNYEDRGYSLMAYEEGIFLPAKEGAYERLIVSLGARWDGSTLEIPVGEQSVPLGFDKKYDSLTGSLGVVYRPTEQFSLAANVGRGWRPPNAFELFARGDHTGVGAFQLGNPNLKEESAVSAELSARYQSRRWRVVATGFRSAFQDYIYLAELAEAEIPPGIPVRPVFFYKQADAVIDGLELSVEATPIETLQVGLSYSTVDTKNDETGARLPQAPPDNLSLRIRGTARNLGPLSSPFAELESLWVGDGVACGEDEVFYRRPFGAGTDSYGLLNLRAGFNLLVAGNVLAVNLTVRNLLNKSYTDFLYPYKGLGYNGRPVLNPGRDVRLTVRFRF
jgi:outer membrane receptor protein involved in Fe transport